MSPVEQDDAYEDRLVILEELGIEENALEHDEFTDEVSASSDEAAVKRFFARAFQEWANDKIPVAGGLEPSSRFTRASAGSVVFTSFPFTKTGPRLVLSPDVPLIPNGYFARGGQRGCSGYPCLTFH